MADSNSLPFREDRLKALKELGEYKDTSLSGFSIRITQSKKTCKQKIRLIKFFQILKTE